MPHEPGMPARPDELSVLMTFDEPNVSRTPDELSISVISDELSISTIPNRPSIPTNNPTQRMMMYISVNCLLSTLVDAV